MPINPWQPKMIHKTEQVIVYFFNIPAIKQCFPFPVRIRILSFLHRGLLLFYSGMPSRTPPPHRDSNNSSVRTIVSFAARHPHPCIPCSLSVSSLLQTYGAATSWAITRPFHMPLHPRGRAISGAPVGGAQRRPGSWPKHNNEPFHRFERLGKWLGKCPQTQSPTSDRTNGISIEALSVLHAPAPSDRRQDQLERELVSLRRHLSPGWGWLLAAPPALTPGVPVCPASSERKRVCFEFIPINLHTAF